MVDGQNTPSQRPAAPHLGGPLGSSGAAPEKMTSAAPSDRAAKVPAQAPPPAAESGQKDAKDPATTAPTASSAARPEDAKAPGAPAAAAAEDAQTPPSPDVADAAKVPASPDAAAASKAPAAPDAAAGATSKGAKTPSSPDVAAATAATAAKSSSAPDVADVAAKNAKTAKDGGTSAEKSEKEDKSAAPIKPGAADPAAANAGASTTGAADPAAANAEASATGAAAKSSGDPAGKGSGGKDAGKSGAKADDKKRLKPEGPPPPSVTAVALAGRDRPPRGVRSSHPGALARGTSEWARRPSGRLILPAILAVLLIGAAGTAGAYLVPQALDSAPAPSPTPGFGQSSAAPSASLPSGAAQPGVGLPSAPLPSTGLPGAPLPSTSLPGVGQPGVPLPGVSSAPAVGGVPSTAVTMPGTITATRPADALSGWAQQVGTKAGVPVIAVQAYGYAELVAARKTPGCRLSWTTLAAIGKVESAHGSVNQSVLNADGTVSPAIYGLPLDGQGGRQMIRDTDQGVLDKDATYDRAIGPMQFIPTTWNELAVGNAVDADGNGIADPNDIDDAALAAALYLCKGGRDMSRPDKWWEGILSYNAVRPYAQEVFTTANQYGQLSRG